MSRSLDRPSNYEAVSPLTDDDETQLNNIYQAGLLEPSEVHLAMGVVGAQLHLTPVDALAVMRRHAAAWDTTLIDVAENVLDRLLDFDV